MQMRNHDFNEAAEPPPPPPPPPLIFFSPNASSLPPLLQAVTTIRNIARQHRKLYLRLDDVEQLRHYAQSAVSKNNSLDDTLSKARAKSRHWEHKAKEGTKRATGTKKERDEAKKEAKIAQLAAVIAGDISAWVEDDLARV